MGLIGLLIVLGALYFAYRGYRRATADGVPFYQNRDVQISAAVVVGVILLGVLF